MKRLKNRSYTPTIRMTDASEDATTAGIGDPPLTDATTGARSRRTDTIPSAVEASGTSLSSSGLAVNRLVSCCNFTAALRKPLRVVGHVAMFQDP